MAISENQLQTWAHQGSVQQSAATYASIKKVLEDPRAPYASRGFNIFLQGSYGNDTNIYADSDVDIVICLTSVYYHEFTNLNDVERARFNARRTDADYSFNDFKRDVTSWLTTNFGIGVRAGKKAIFVPGTNNRRDADVLACVEHHDYYAYPEHGSAGFHKGICFWTSQGEKIVNYPKQHMDNCATKHGGTQSRFKPNVRVIKNMRNAMIAGGYLDDGVAPSYFIEGLLYNVPNGNFTNSYQSSFENSLAWLERCNSSELLCANERYYLIWDSDSVCWNQKDFQATLAALRRYWNSSGR